MSDHKRAERFGRLMMNSSINHQHSNNQLLKTSSAKEDKDFEEEEAFEDIDLDKISQEGHEAGLKEGSLEEYPEDKIEEEYYKEDDEEGDEDNDEEDDKMKSCKEVDEEATYEEVEIM